MTSKLIDKLTKFCFHSASPTTPASHTHNTSPNGEGRDYRNRPIVRNNKAKFYRLYHQILFILYTQSLFVIMLFCLQKNHLSPFVIMSFCLQESPFLRLSLCYSVSKTSSVSIRPYVTLSPKTLCHYMSLCHFVSKKNLSLLVPMLFCLQNILTKTRTNV